MAKDFEHYLYRAIRFILLTVWKMCIILLFGVLRLAEVILGQINGYLKKLIK